MNPILRRTGLTFLLTAGLASCVTPAELSDAELATVAATLADYRSAWLRGDAEAVLAHVSDSTMLFVPGVNARTIVGKASVRSFWFPASDTSFRITTYEISDQEIHGGGGYAVAQGRSLLSWETVARDSVLSSSTSTSEYLSILRKEAGRWMIYRQMSVARN